MDELRPLIIKAKDGDLEAFGKLTQRFRRVAVRYAQTILGRPDLAEDAVQEAFVQAYFSLPKLTEPAAFAMWFRAIVHNCSHRVIRSDRRVFAPLEDAADIPSQEPGPDELALANEMSQRVIEAVTRLPEHERAVVRLFYFEDCSQKDIAGLLGVPVTTVNNRLHSSRMRLKRQPEILDLGPAEPQRPKEVLMRLRHEATKRRLLKGDVDLVIRAMTRDDLPAMRRLDDEIAASLDFANAQRAPGTESGVGGPWSDDQELARHLDKYEASGNIILVAEDESGKLVGFAELWAAHEPAPFGDSLDAECIDYLWEYHHLGIETVLLQEAEKVARAAGMPALDVGTNTSSGSYPTLRTLGMKVFYEYDNVWCKCEPQGPKPDYRMIEPGKAQTSGLLRINHWAPTDFDFEHTPGRPPAHEFTVEGRRVIADLWRLWEPGYEVPDACELFAPPAVLKSPELMSKAAQVVAFIAGEAGAKEIPVPFPCDMPADPSQVDVTRREFAFAWMRKSLEREGERQ